MPAIPGDAALAKWFDVQFPPLEKHRTWRGRADGRGATPDIPRPGYAYYEQDLESRTFGVVVDTSGSMSAKQIGMALGSIASYAAGERCSVRENHFLRCQSDGCGISGTGRYCRPGKSHGTRRTILQPGVDCLEQANDFPKDGPILDYYGRGD